MRRRMLEIIMETEYGQGRDVDPEGSLDQPPLTS